MDLTRRRFLLFGGTLLLVLPLADAVVTGCNDDECGGAGGIRMDGTDLVVTSSCTVGHTHTLTLTAGELAFPPAEGLSKDTSLYEGGHFHVVMLSQAELSTIDGGGTVTRESSLASGHTHEFTIMKA